MKKTIVLLIFLMHSGAYAGAMTLSEALDYALSHNRNVLAAKEKLNAAGGKVIEARAGFLPSLSAQGSYNYLSLIPAFQIQAPGPGGQTVTRTSYLGANDNWMYKASLQQTLFAWGRVSNSYAIAKLNREMAEQDYKKTVSETVYAVTNAYYSSVLAKEFYNLNKESLGRLADHLRAVSDRFKVGAASQFELLRASVQVSNQTPVVSRARNAIELSDIFLKNAVGMGLDEKITVDNEIPFQPVDYDFNSAIKDALLYRPEIIQSEIRNKIAKRNISVSRSANMPSILAGAIWNYQNPFYNRVEWVDNWSAGVTINFPFFDGFATYGRIRQSKSELSQSNIAGENLRFAAEVEVRQAMLSIDEAKERISSQKDNVGQAEESVRIAEVSYKNGAATNLEVMDTHLALMQAKTNYLQALFDYRIACAALEKATGRIAVR